MCSCKPSGRNEGMALILALGVMTALAIIATALVTSFHRSLDRAHRQELNVQCLYLAEAGVEKALAELTRADQIYRGEDRTPLGEGSFSVEVTSPKPQWFTIVSSGRLLDGSVRSRIVVDAELVPGGSIQVRRWEEFAQ